MKSFLHKYYVRYGFGIHHGRVCVARSSFWNFLKDLGSEFDISLRWKVSSKGSHLLYVITNYWGDDEIVAEEIISNKMKVGGVSYE